MATAVKTAELNVPLMALEKAMGLPPNVRIAGVSDTGDRLSMRFAYVGKKIPECVCVDELSLVGDMFDHPKKYVRPLKGSTLRELHKAGEE